MWRGSGVRGPSARFLAVLLPVLWLATLGSAAGAIYSKHRARELFVQLEKLNRERDRLEIEWGQLQLEQSAWSTHAFVENVAAQKLRMAIPQPAEIEVVAP
ncbi:MAG: cell division protein FtsL [Sinobacteraceae bacterium]|nr:cell division protein FtsL [Nevskiaceae bacterium]MCP5466306.1 cell division protein FtsL [Nevskiaceae bacterium]MCP5471708.1 cell division protein FtsL [Nevskiaceae bacterium]